jgi:hypothetical protein
MRNHRHVSSSVLLRRLGLSLIILVSAHETAQAEPFTPAHIVRISFDLRGYTPPPELETVGALEFAVGLVPVTSIESYTAKLFDRGRLLGAYSAGYSDLQGTVLTARFISPTSTSTIGPATIVDFQSFRDGTFAGGVDFTIQAGRANVLRTSDEISLGRAFTPSENFHTLPNSTFEIIQPNPAPVPEPASVLLLLTGAAGLLGVWKSKLRHS